MLKLVSFLFQYSPRLLVLTLVAGAVSGAANTVVIALLNRGIASERQALPVLALSFLGVCLVLPLTRICAEILLAFLSQNAVYDLRMQLCRGILKAPLRDLERHGPDKILATLTNDITLIANALPSIPAICMHLAIVVSCLGYLAWLFLPGGFILLGTTVLGVAGYMAVFSKAGRHFELAREDGDALQQHYRGLTFGNKELKLNYRRQRQFEKDGLEQTSASFKRHQIRSRIYLAAAGSMGHLLFFVAMGILVFLLPFWVTTVTREVLTGYSMVLLFLFVPLDGLTSMMPTLGTAAASLRKVTSLGFSLERVSGPDVFVPTSSGSWHSLKMEAVTHSYHREAEDQCFTMGPLDLEFKPGETTFVIGGNGSGKTTFAKLLTGLYSPESGTIFFDGEPIDECSLVAYRQNFSVVFSDFFLFETLYGLTGPGTEETAKSYLERLQLHHKVTLKDNKWSSLELSQGQRKRLALLTAFLEDRPIYVFDEWAADQDPYFKDIFYNAILVQLKQKGKTVLAISHDDHYYHRADRLIKIDVGQVEFDRTAAAAQL